MVTPQNSGNCKVYFYYTAPLKEIKAKINVLKFGKIHFKVHFIPDIKTHFLKISIEGN